MSGKVIKAEDKLAAANRITRESSLYAAGVGLIPFPAVDLAALLVIQVVMVRKIARVYGLTDLVDQKKIKQFVQSLISSLGASGVVSGAKAFPIIGSIVGVFSSPIVGAASTYATGKVFTLHFAHGGTLLEFDPEKIRDFYEREFRDQLKSKSRRSGKLPVRKKKVAKKLKNQNS